MAADPAFAATAKRPTPVKLTTVPGATVLTAPDITSTGDRASLITGGTNGTKITEVVLHSTGTSVAGFVALFIYAGGTHYLYDMIPITAITGSVTVQPFHRVIRYENLILASGQELRAIVTVTQTTAMAVHVEAADF